MGEKDLIKNIHLDDRKAMMLPEKDLAALSSATPNKFIPRVEASAVRTKQVPLPLHITNIMKSYLTQDLLLQELKEKIEQREKAATTIQRRVRGSNLLSPKSPEGNSAGGAAAPPRAKGPGR